MAGKRSENRAAALKLYLEQGGKISCAELADLMNESVHNIRWWKRQDLWDEKAKEMNEGLDCKAEREVEELCELSESEKMFCISYVHNFNVRQAAVNAGYSVGRAKQIGYELLKKPCVVAEIEKLKAVRRSALLVDLDDILERQMQIAFADITDFVDFGTEEITVVDKKTNEAHTKLVNIVYLKNSKDVCGGVIAEVWRGADGSARIKLADRQKAIDWLSKFFVFSPLEIQRYEMEKIKMKLAEKENGDSPIEIRLLGKEVREDECKNESGFEEE